MEAIDKLFNKQNWFSRQVDKTKEALQKGIDYVKENPEKTALTTGAAVGAGGAIAAGLGALALARKLRRLKEETPRKPVPKSVSK